MSVTLSGVLIYGIPPENQTKYVSGVLLSASGTSTATAGTAPQGYYLFDNNLQAGGMHTVASLMTENINGITAFDATLVLPRTKKESIRRAF
ncbi:MAG: hypothetical protein M3209_05210 [Acidobacteriota bacterium]|nr:hypothetical protein [Acidobacteriota bacterium]